MVFRGVIFNRARKFFGVAKAAVFFRAAVWRFPWKSVAVSVWYGDGDADGGLL